MNPETVAVTETTPEGLTALTSHIANAAAQGQLDPEFVRKLCKRIGKELELMQAAGMLSQPALAGLEEAVQALRCTADHEESAMLTRALRRLREEDSGPHGNTVGSPS